MSTAEVVADTGTSVRTALSRVTGAATQGTARPAEKKTAKTAPCISPEERFQMISEAAYLRAEQRGFLVGDDLADWLAAESEIDALLLGDEISQSSR